MEEHGVVEARSRGCAALAASQASLRVARGSGRRRRVACQALLVAIAAGCGPVEPPRDSRASAASAQPAPPAEPVAADREAELRSLYLDLMRETLTDLVYENHPKTRAKLRADVSAWRAALRGEPYEFPTRAHTMIGTARLDNIRTLVEDVLSRGVPGDLLEAGAWRGGATIYMRAVLEAHGDTERRVWVADSFEGLPPPDAESYPADAGYDLSGIDELAVSQQEVERNFRRYGLLDDRVRFLKGWFKDTLGDAPIQELSVLRIDADLYESTMDVLRPLYPKLSSGGYVIIDDYGSLPPCKKAVADYRAEHGITAPIEVIDWTGVYWRKE
jgi:hypothetical protein